MLNILDIRDLTQKRSLKNKIDYFYFLKSHVSTKNWSHMITIMSKLTFGASSIESCHTISTNYVMLYLWTMLHCVYQLYHIISSNYAMLCLSTTCHCVCQLCHVMSVNYATLCSLTMSGYIMSTKYLWQHWNTRNHYTSNFLTIDIIHYMYIGIVVEKYM